jgi:hypothetical protein
MIRTYTPSDALALFDLLEREGDAHRDIQQIC